MLKIFSKNGIAREVVFNGDSLSGTVNGKPFLLDSIDLGGRRSHIIYNGSSINAEILELNREKRELTLSLNGRTHHLSVRDRFDDLLENKA